MLSNDTLPVAVSLTRPRQLGRVYLTLAKARLSAMVVITTGVGYLIAPQGADRAGLDYAKLFWTVLGTALAAAGASAFNQLWESRRDAMMRRTSSRPLPAKIISPTHAAFFGLFACAGGLAILCPGANGLTAVLAFINIMLYVVVYTPMKPRTTLNTLVGAVVGALPPMMGWAAATGRLDTGAWLLGALLFVWQIPHFMALAWMYRADYARGGFRMCSVTDPTGRTTSLHTVLYSLTLLPIGVMFWVLGLTGWIFAAGSLVLGGVMVWYGLRFAGTLADAAESNASEQSTGPKASPDMAAARRLFLWSIIYLPVLLVLMLLTSHPR